MKSFKEKDIKKYYDSDKDNILDDFFIPTLGNAKIYKRLAGFFSSKILSAAAFGVAGLIENNGHMQLMISTFLNKEDLQVIQGVHENPEAYIEKMMLNELKDLTNIFIDDHLKALGWMLANNLLEIRIGIIESGGMFHLKVGVMEDEFGNKISFSGSENETFSGWSHNIEEFKVFRSWITEENDYLKNDEEKFDRFWLGNGNKVRTVKLSEAVKNKLISIAPEDKNELNLIKNIKNRINLYPHQIKAIEAINIHEGRGIISMATGSGKTITAISYIKKSIESASLCTVIAVPYSHLARQWIDENIIKVFPRGVVVEVYGDSKKWKKKLRLYLHAFVNKKISELFIVGIYGSLASDDYIAIISDSGIDSESILYIADEVHNAGAKKTQKGLLDLYSRRIGLSATPERYFDEEGTKVILDYFNGIIFEYEISDAIRDNFLTPYNYYPVKVELTFDEYEEYCKLSERILKSMAINYNNDIIDSSNIEKLLLARSRIIKKAVKKIEITKEIINQLINKHEYSLNKTLIYCDDLIQVDLIQKVLNELNIINHKFTDRENNKERKEILNNFSNDNYQALVSIRCLDEGVDIPDASIAIIVASTTNPREYIQRRGRVLRKSSGKTEANIFDLFVVPPTNSFSNYNKVEKMILEKEFTRIKDFVNSSKNPSSSYNSLMEIMKKFNIYL